MGFFRKILPRQHDRYDKDTSQDVLLLLYLLKKCGGKIADKDIFSAKIKLMKLVFLAEYQMVENNVKGFNFFFNIYKKGPSSKELLGMIDSLLSGGLLEKKSNAFSLKKDGEITIEDFVDFDDKNKPIFKIVDDVVNENAKLSTDDLLKKVYAMNIVPKCSHEKVNIGKEVGIAGGGPGRRLLMKLSEDEVKIELNVSPEWIETVKILLNPAFSRE